MHGNHHTQAGRGPGPHSTQSTRKQAKPKSRAHNPCTTGGLLLTFSAPPDFPPVARFAYLRVRPRGLGGEARSLRPSLLVCPRP